MVIKMDNITNIIREKLFRLSEKGYKNFQSSLIPNVDPDTVIGVRTPLLRNFAKELSHTPSSAEFLKILPHKYYEENNLHGLLIELIKDYDMALAETERFLPHIDNWATCDLLRPKAFKKNLPRLYEKIKSWTSSDHTYTIRFGIEMLMVFYLDNNFSTEHLELVSEITTEEYYVNMMRAWYFATALAKQYDDTVKVIVDRRLDKWTHNKTIQKAIESRRIADPQKAYLKTLKII